MVRICKHEDQNSKEGKCNDYYYGGPRHNCMCRLTEWKQKVGACPYDKTIFSLGKVKKDAKDPAQRSLKSIIYL